MHSLAREAVGKTETQKWASNCMNPPRQSFYINTGIPMTKKKFAELELSLLHLQQNVEIPETHLVIHPAIQRAVEQVNFLEDCSGSY
jgi:hypothetical protein